MDAKTLGKPRSKEIKVILLRSFLSSADSVAKFALILSPLASEPDITIEIPIKMKPIPPVPKYALSIPQRNIDTKIPISDKPIPSRKYFKIIPLYLIIQLDIYFVSFHSYSTNLQH